MTIFYVLIDELTFPRTSDPDITKDVSTMKDFVLQNLQECPTEITEMVQNSDPESANIETKVWYRPPWQVMFGNFQNGTVTIAGDAMHVMGPFIGQGGSAGLEDAVVLARSLSRAVPDGLDGVTSDRELYEKISVAIGSMSGRGGQGWQCCLWSLSLWKHC